MASLARRVGSVFVCLLLAAGCRSAGDGTTSDPVTVPTTVAVPTTSSVVTPAPTAPAPSAPAPVTEQQAGELALTTVGGGRVLKVEHDEEDGRPTWKVEVITTAGEKRKVEVEQATGAILKNERDD